MNKRIKLKKGILHKRCDDNCYNYRMIVDAMFITNNSCSNCKFCEDEKIQNILEKNFKLSHKCRRVTLRKAQEIINTRKPVGTFWTKEKDLYVGIDNRTGDAWCEDFKTIEECFEWLLEEE